MGGLTLGEGCAWVHALAVDGVPLEEVSTFEEAMRLNHEFAMLLEAGKYDEAMPLAERALALFEKALGSMHPNVAASLNNLAELYLLKGDYARAEPLYQRALAIWEKAVGSKHPNVAKALNNLAELYQ